MKKLFLFEICTEIKERAAPSNSIVVSIETKLLQIIKSRNKVWQTFRFLFWLTISVYFIAEAVRYYK